MCWWNCTGSFIIKINIPYNPSMILTIILLFLQLSCLFLSSFYHLFGIQGSCLSMSNLPSAPHVLQKIDRLVLHLSMLSSLTSQHAAIKIYQLRGRWFSRMPAAAPLPTLVLDPGPKCLSRLELSASSRNDRAPNLPSPFSTIPACPRGIRVIPPQVLLCC